MAPQDFPPPPYPPPPPPPPPSRDPPRSSTFRKQRHEDDRTSSVTDFDGLATSIPTISTSTSDSADSTYSVAAISTPPWKPYSGKPWPPKPPPHPNTIAAAVGGAMGAVGALAVICIIIGGCLFCCRKAKKRKNVPRGMPPPLPQMVKTNGQSIAPTDTRAYAPSSSILPPPLSLTSTSTGSAPSTRTEEAPILLSTNIDRSYYTGIDTSDALSITDNQRPPSQYAASIAEPPPPYRPTSIPSFSRENSCRASGAPPSYRPRLSLISPGSVVRSPFDDPEGDSPVSQIGAASHTESPVVRDMEEMSDVSELSYQQEPVQARSSL